MVKLVQIFFGSLSDSKLSERLVGSLMYVKELGKLKIRGFVCPMLCNTQVRF